MRARCLALFLLAACNLTYPANVGPTDAPQGTIDSLLGAPDAMVDGSPLPDAAPGTLGLDVDNAHFYVHVGGGMVSIGVTLSRGAGIDGDVTISVPSPPTGVTFDPLTIPSGSSTGQLVTHVVSSTAPLGESTVTVNAVSGIANASDTLDLEVIGKVGAVDVAFGTSGTVLIGGATPVALFPQAEKLVEVSAIEDAGRAFFDATRLTLNGSTDPSFGTSGHASYDFNQAGILANPTMEASVQSDGAIVLAGSGDNDAGDGDPFVARITADGTIDTTLGPARSDTTSADDHVFAVAIDTVHPTGMPDQILVAGSTGASDATQDGALMRLTATGSLDTSFGRAKATTTNPVDQFDSILVQPSGKILAVDHLFNTIPSQSLYVIQPNVSIGAYSTNFTAGVWVNAIGLASGSVFFAWGEDGGKSGFNEPSRFAVWTCTDNGVGGAVCSAYEAAGQSMRTQAVVNLVAVPDGSGYLAVGYDLDNTTPSANDYTLDTIALAPNLAAITSVGTNGIVRDTSIKFQPFAAVAQDNHRYAVLGILNPGNSPSVAVRRYFW